MLKYLFLLLFVVELSAMTFDFEIVGLDTTSKKVEINANLYGPPLYFQKISEIGIKTSLRTLSFAKMLPWLVNNPAYSLDFDTVSFFETGYNISGLPEIDVGWAESKIFYAINKDLSEFSSTNHRFVKKEDVLRVGIFSDRETGQEIKNDPLFLANAVFAKKVGVYLGKKVVFSLFNQKGDCLRELLLGEIDLAIAEFPSSDDFPEKIAVSEPYFETGSVFASINCRWTNTLSTAGPGIPGLGFAAIKNSQAHELIVSLADKRSKVYSFPNLSVLKKVLWKVDIKNQGEKSLIAFIPEIEASIDPHLFVIENKNKRCWTWERYVVLGTDKRLIRFVNQVIVSGKISSLYANLSGRSERR